MPKGKHKEAGLPASAAYRKNYSKKIFSAHHRGKDGSPATRGLRDALHGQQDKVNEEASVKNQTSTDANSLAAKIILAVTVIALAVQLAISQVIAGSVTSALDSMRHVCEKLRDGDFRAGDHALERADEFGHLSTTMQQDTESAVSSMNEGCEAVVAGAQSVENLQKVFEQILSLVENGAQKTILMDKAIKLVSSDAQNISASVADINAKGQVISQHMESVSAATEQQSASSEEIASASETLSNMAREQQQALRQFKF